MEAKLIEDFIGLKTIEDFVTFINSLIRIKFEKGKLSRIEKIEIYDSKKIQENLEYFIYSPSSFYLNSDSTISTVDLMRIVISKKEYYTTFFIPKKGNNRRQITAPQNILKLIQNRLSSFFYLLDNPKNNIYSHGFEKGKNIITNASQHCNKKHILSLDLENFFGNILKSKVYSILKASPFDCNDEIAKIISELICFNNILPQGSPTSPILSNYATYQLDESLNEVSKNHHIIYSRYADDLTFSSQKYIENSFVSLVENEVIKYGFKINSKKTRIISNKRRQTVTGIVVNHKTNIPRKEIKRIRAILFSWKTKGFKETVENFRTFNPKYKKRKSDDFFVKVILGKIDFIGQVRGRNDFYYRSFMQQYNRLVNLKEEPKPSSPDPF